MKADIKQSKTMLRVLLQQDKEASLLVSGMDKISDGDRLFLLSTCSASIITHTICRTCGYDLEEAKKGLAALNINMVEHLTEICARRL